MNESNWNKKAEAAFVGRRIVGARYMAENEARNHGWSHRPLILMLDDGTAIYSSQDDEGNDGGALFGVGKNGEDKSFPVLQARW